MPEDTAVWCAYDVLRKETILHDGSCRCAGCNVKAEHLAKLCKIHEPLAYKYLGRFLSKWSMFGSIPVEDARQAAKIGLMQAIRKNTPERGKFAAYVHLWIRLELTKCAESFGVRVKKLPLSAADYRRVVDVEIKTGRLANPEDVPGIPEKKLRDAQWRPQFSDIQEEDWSSESVDDEGIESLIDRHRVAQVFDESDRTSK